MTVDSDTAWDIDYGCYTDVGRVRQRNEDAAKVSPDIFLYAVADGMGGHRAGDRASRIAVQTLHDYLANADSGDESAEDTVRAAFQKANRSIIEDASGRPDRMGMGTTLTALIVNDGGYLIGHVGDSRALRVRDGSIEQLTEDHSIVADQVREGCMTEEEAQNHPMRHVLSRCMGCEPDPEVDVLTGEVQDGDVFVLGSDGLTGALGVELMAETIMAASDAATASKDLVELAREKDGSDNITAVVVRCTASPAPS
ncbi:MAG: Stp1/IreP family PP2C-type Ser/Thr phosphatase [Acidobacteria bacterium]|nr:Stp1/IreP family PP2C-type Ser/Thr phosphatase [Acidobacteriota bacterium]